MHCLIQYAIKRKWSCCLLSVVLIKKLLNVHFIVVFDMDSCSNRKFLFLIVMCLFGTIETSAFIWRDNTTPKLKLLNVCGVVGLVGSYSGFLSPLAVKTVVVANVHHRRLDTSQCCGPLDLLEDQRKRKKFLSLLLSQLAQAKLVVENLDVENVWEI